MVARAVLKCVMLGGVALATAGCEVLPGQNKITDSGFDGGLLENGRANVWIDPDGCQHWYIDDGVEGYMTPRLNRDGTPRCEQSRGTVVLKDGTVMQYDPAVFGDS